MATYKAAVLSSLEKPLELSERSIPTAVQGSVVVKVLATYVLPYLKAVLEGKIPYAISLPIVPCASAIARVHSVGKDATVLKPGQLVLCDMTIRARDEPSNVVLQGLHAGATLDLMAQWSDGSFAEYATFPMESVFALDEARLCGDLGYTVEDLCLVPICNVPFGGLATIDVQPGETVIIAPATGKFGGAAVLTALAMGARVIAAGRTAEKLKNLEESFKSIGRLQTVVLSGDSEQDANAIRQLAGPAGVDCYVDFSESIRNTEWRLFTNMHLRSSWSRSFYSRKNMSERTPTTWTSCVQRRKHG